MRKLSMMVGFVCAVLVASVVYATVTIDWYWDENTGAGVFQNGGINLLPQNSIIQLIYSPTGINTGYQQTNPLLPVAGNTLLATLGSTGNGFWNFGTASYPQPGVVGQYVGGFVFQRVFDTLMSNSPTNDSFYGDGPMSTALANADGEPTPPPDASWFFSSGGSTPYVLSQRVVVIPEPTTWALMGIGALAMIIRRRRA